MKIEDPERKRDLSEEKTLCGERQTSGVSLIAFLCSPGFPGRQKSSGLRGRKEFIIPKVEKLSHETVANR